MGNTPPLQRPLWSLLSGASLILLVCHFSLSCPSRSICPGGLTVMCQRNAIDYRKINYQDGALGGFSASRLPGSSACVHMQSRILSRLNCRKYQDQPICANRDHRDAFPRIYIINTQYTNLIFQRMMPKSSPIPGSHWCKSRQLAGMYA